MKDLVKAYFTFSRKELNGIVILFLLSGIGLGLPHLLRYFGEPAVYDFDRFRQEVALFRASAVRSASFQELAKDTLQAKPPEAFMFDPNGLAESEWQRLGLSARQIAVIKNYEAKGGKFYRKEDLGKIYSISPDEYLRLEPFIRIKSFPSSSRATPRRPRQAFKKIELNSADSADLETLPGIGPVFASRIIRFRARLGGFYSKLQLLEVYGLDSLKYRQIRERVEADISLINKIEINSVSFEQLKKHPYLNYKQVNAVLRYREQHGRYMSVTDLKKVIILDEEIIRKIEPYLSF